MAKIIKKTLDWSNWLIGIIISIAIGGLFISGVTLNLVLLKFLPVIIHTIVGWLIIIGALIAIVTKFVK